MLRFRFLPLVFLAASASVCHAEGSFGKYIGRVQTEWLDQDDRRMRLLAPFSFVDPKGRTWTAPAGWVIDGASIPVFAWSVIGGPFNGKYRDASVIHDVACDQKTQPWEDVHEAFYYAMMASGVEPWRAKVMYAAVYHFGPRWPRVVTVSVPGDHTPDAQAEALAQAEPGSGATIVGVQPAAPAAPGASGAGQQTVAVQIQPPPQKLTPNDFEKLKARIIEVESAPPAAKPAARTRSFSRPSGGAGEEMLARRGTNPQEGVATGVSLSDIRNFTATE